METVRPMHERYVEPARATADLVLDWRHEPDEWATTVMAMVRGLRESQPKAAAPAARESAAEA
jgi:uridine kinase